MAHSSLCVSCAQLPQKDRALAIKTQGCPDCNNTFGVTSYGAAFRIKAVKRTQWLSPSLGTGMAVGAGLFMLVVILVGLGLWSKDQVITTKRVPDPIPGDELLRVPQVAITDPMASNIAPHVAKQRLADLVREIKAENGNGADRDRFLFTLMKRRPETRGLPFVMGDACRMDVNKSQSFQNNVEAVRQSLDADSPRRAHGEMDDTHAQFWNTYGARNAGNGANSEAGIAALTQMIAPERAALRKTLVQRLSNSNRTDAARALARAAVFDRDADVRELAIHHLKNRENVLSNETKEILLQGMRYPMMSVVKQSAVALLALDRNKDLLPELVAMLDEPAPGDPVPKHVDDKEVCTVREVVRINHHRNCLLCHSPTQTGQPNEVPGVIPTPGMPFAQSASEAYGSAQSQGDPMIRADTTYLRQDFSVLMPVENPGAWPEKQRFDFLVRTRVVDGAELDILKDRVRARAGAPTDQQKTVHALLRQMTGQDAAPNRAAWERVLGLAKAE